MITLYDIPSKFPGKSFSYNPFKARLAITFKGLEFKTEWVEMCDIEPRMKELGANPTTTKPDGSPKYTLPVIFDDATGKYVSESMKIAEYLETTYRDKPSLFPFNTFAPINLFNEYFPSVIQPAYPAFVSRIPANLNAPSFDYIRKRQEAMHGKPLEEIFPQGEERASQLAAAKANFTKLAVIYASNGEEKPYFYGDVPSYADLILVAHLIWIKVALGAESKDWIAISEDWDNGRWGKLLKLLQKYNIST